jgi:hypothetical protein
VHRMSALTAAAFTAATLGLAAPSAFAIGPIPTDVQCGTYNPGGCLVKAEAPGAAGTAPAGATDAGNTSPSGPSGGGGYTVATPEQLAAARAAALAVVAANCAPLTGGAAFTPAQAAACLTVPTTPPGPGAPAAPPPPNPAVVAQVALTDMNLRPVTIGIVPENTQGKVGVVGAPAWMWAANPGEASTGPMTRSATVGGVTVQATATLDKVVWDMGDGSTVTCAGTTAKGTPYYDAAGLKPSPTCGHTYTQPSSWQPGLAYTVTATSYWTVNWQGGGGAGVIPQVLGNQTQIQIGELQVITTG